MIGGQNMAGGIIHSRWVQPSISTIRTQCCQRTDQCNKAAQEPDHMKAICQLHVFLQKQRKHLSRIGSQPGAPPIPGLSKRLLRRGGAKSVFFLIGYAQCRAIFCSVLFVSRIFGNIDDSTSLSVLHYGRKGFRRNGFIRAATQISWRLAQRCRAFTML